MNFSKYLWTAIHFVIFILTLVSKSYDALVYTLTITMVLMVLDKLGKGIVLREIIALHCCFISLLMPLAGYRVYNHDNVLAVLWVRYMVVAEASYFSYCLPAVSGFCMMLCLPFRSGLDTGATLKKAVESIKVSLKGNQRLGLILVVLGCTTTFFVSYLPTGIQYVFNLLYFGAFAGVLYIYFSGKFLYKNLLLIAFGVFIVWLALRTGMFTIFAYMGMTMFSFFFLGRKASLLAKTLIFFGCISLLAIIQIVKPTYRKAISRNGGADKAEVFIDIASKSLGNFNNFFSPDAYFFLYYRANQGFNIALVIRRFPERVPYDNGSYLMVKIAAAFVPRILWPDKPEAGGVANMKYYANMTIRGWSTNVAPMSEGYASFGPTGGIVFMLLLGLFIRMAYGAVFRVGRRIPLIILWIPVMFYQVTYSSENDTLQILNSLIKSSFFIYLLFKIFPSLFKPSIKDKEDNVQQQGRGVSRLQPSQHTIT